MPIPTVDLGDFHTRAIYGVPFFKTKGTFPRGKDLEDCL